MKIDFAEAWPWIEHGSVLFVVVYATYIVTRHGWVWAVGKVGTWFTKGKADLVSLEARVAALESHAVVVSVAPAPVVVPVVPPVTKP